MIRKHLPFAFALAAVFCVGGVARAETPPDTAPSSTKLTVTPALLTTNADQVSAPVTEVQYRRRAYRRGWSSYPYRYSSRYPSYRYSYSYPRYSYGYYPYSRYSSYSRPYYGSYYNPRYYTGYRGGFRYYGPRFSGSFYW